MAPHFFRILLICIILYAFIRGGRDERAVAALCAVGTVATLLVVSPVAGRFDNVEMGVVAIDALMLVGFTFVALTSYRFWPLWVAGLQLTTMIGHLLKGFDSNLLPKAYGAAMIFWSYPIILILAIGTWRHWRRTKEESSSDAIPG